MISFYPFRAEMKKTGIVSSLSESEVKIRDTISCFLAYASKRSGGSLTKDIVYYICLEQNTVLFRISNAMKLTGMYFKENEIINSWNNLFYLIQHLFNMEYDNISSADSILISGDDPESRQSPEAEHIINILKKKYKNKYIPFSFIAGEDASVFYNPEIKGVDYPLTDEIPGSYDDVAGNRKICIPYDESFETKSDDNGSEIYYRMPENTKKGFMQFFRNKREQPSDFINNVFLKANGEDVQVTGVTQQCSEYERPDSYLFRFDKIIYATGGDK